MKLSKKIARKIVFPALMAVRTDRLIRLFSKKKILNVMYHGVVEEDSNYFSPRHLWKEQFEQHLKYLKANFDVISDEEAFRRVAAKETLKRHTITITFDDGFLNNLRTALPLIEKYQIPVTLFVSSLCAIDDNAKCLWADYIAAINHFYPSEVVEIAGFKFVNGFDSKKNQSISDFIKLSSCHDRDRIMTDLINKYDLDEKLKTLPTEVWKLMSRDELSSFAKSKYVNIGTHGHNHYNLGSIKPEEAKQDLERSLELLNELIPEGIDSIAYPDGSYSDEVKQIAQELGIKRQFAVNYKNESDLSDPRIMNRHGVSSRTTLESSMLFLNLAIRKKGVKLN
ncbi:polysaccharide deacetylase family protein [bacterium]|nr:polysaccharide deacetylase family protein [bacterium]